MILLNRPLELLIIRISAALLFTIAVQTQIYSQQLQSAQPQGLVKLNVIVTDSSNQLVSDIKQEEFRVSDNNQPQSISFFSKESPPLTYGIVVDNSRSFINLLKPVVESAKVIVSGNNAGDETLITRFVDSGHIEVIQNITSDKALLATSLNTLYIGDGQTAVIDAIYLSAKRIADYKEKDGANRRRALILITDGEDRESYYRREQLVDLLRKEDIEVFVIGIVINLNNDDGGQIRKSTRERATELLKSIAKETGGLAFFPKSPSELQRVANEIMLYLRTQYVIGYTPSGKVGKGGFHKVRVEILDPPGQEKRIPITRSGYVVPKADK